MSSLVSVIKITMKSLIHVAYVPHYFNRNFIFIRISNYFIFYESTYFYFSDVLTELNRRSMDYPLMNTDGGGYMYTANGSNYSFWEYQSILDEYFANLSKIDNGEEQYTRDMLTYCLMGIGGLVVCSLGIVGNVVSLTVLQRKSMKSSTYSYLAALAVCDMFVLLCTIVLLWKDIEPPQRGKQKWPWVEGIYPYLFPFFHPAAFSFQVTSVWLTLAFTVDRYIMICHPFTAEPFCTVSRARKVIASIFVTASAFNLPKFFEYETIPVTLPQNITKIGCDLTEFGRSQLFRKLYHSWFYIAFVCAVPFVTLAVLNAFLMHAVHKSRKRGREINVAEKKRNDTTIMLISVVVVFFICQTPALVSRTIWAFESDPDAFKRIPLYSLNEIGNFLIILNSSINFVPYYFFGKRFRKEFIKIFCRCILHYKKFQKLSHSFTLTMMDQQREQQQQQQQRIETGSNSYLPKSDQSNEKFKLNCIRKGSYLTVPPQHVQNSESGGSGDTDTLYEPFTGNTLPSMDEDHYICTKEHEQEMQGEGYLSLQYTRSELPIHYSHTEIPIQID